MRKLLCFFVFLAGLKSWSQEVKVIDNKGTLKNISQDRVFSSTTTPTSPVEGDLWLNTNTQETKAYDQDSSSWIQISLSTTLIKDWLSTAAYQEDEVVIQNQKVYRANSTIPANTSFVLGTSSSTWSEISKAAINNWDVNENFGLEKIVVYQGKLYRNTSGNTTVNPPDQDTTNWTKASSSNYLGYQTIHHNNPTTLAISETLHNLSDIHIESTGDLSMDSTDVSDGTSLYLSNTTTADRLLQFTNFSGAFLRNGGAEIDLSFTGLTLKANTRYLVHVTDNGGNFYFNATEASAAFSLFWNPNSNYLINQIINHQGVLYRNLTAVNTTTAPPIDTVNWTPLSDASVTAWTSLTNGGTYTTNQLVSHQGVIYRNSTATNTDNAPDSDPTNWETLRATDSQILAFGVSNTQTTTTLEVSGGNAISLQVTDALSLSQTGTHTLLLSAKNTNIYNTDASLSASRTIDLNGFPLDFQTAVGNSVLYMDPINQRLGVGTITPSQSLSISGSLSLSNSFYDSKKSPGINGQLLSSTGTGTAWINSSTSNSLFDTDGNTGIQVEETTNEDFIRFDTAGQERFVIDSAGRICVNTTNPIDTFNLTGDMFLTHNSVQSDDHAFEIDVNAGGFGDVKALDIVYQTGALGAESDEGVILVNIDESASTGGAVVGLEVLATEGTAALYGLEVGANINPVEQLSGFFSDVTVGEINGVDNLSSFASSSLNQSIFSNDNETLTVGFNLKFQEIEFLLNTVASGNGIIPTFEYSTGLNTWASFTPTDGTNGMKNSGVIAWLPGDLASWATSGGNYLVRITRTRNSLTTSPIESIIKVANTTEYQWDKDGKLSIAAINNGGTYEDSNGEAGSAGQLLSSTVSGTDWISFPPRLTNTEKALRTFTASDIIFNKDSNKHEGYDGTNWFDLY